MQITVSGHHVEVTSSLREYVESKLQRLERHFDHLTTVHVVLSVEKLRQKAEATLHLAGANLFADAIEVATALFAAWSSGDVDAPRPYLTDVTIQSANGKFGIGASVNTGLKVDYFRAYVTDPETLTTPLLKNVELFRGGALGDLVVLAIRVGAATERLWLSYPRIEIAESRPRVPSFYALDVMRAVTGTIPNHEDLQASAAEEGGAGLAWPSPASPLVAIGVPQVQPSALALPGAVPQAGAECDAQVQGL